jgi:hypothetical protein
MNDEITVEEAKEGSESLGMWMESRYHLRFIGLPIQQWEMPPKEKEFFTFYAMNIVMESEGFDSLKNQPVEDVKAFTKMLKKLGAKKTADLVETTLEQLRGGASCDEDEGTEKYYDLVAREKAWVKLLDYVGRKIFMWYLEKAQLIGSSGGNTFDPKAWQD